MLGKIANGCVLILFAIWIAALGFEALTASQQIPSEQQTQRTNTAQQSTERGKTFSLNQSHPDEKTDQRTTKQRQAAHSAKEFLVNFFEIKLTDLAIAVFTIVLAVKTAGLFRETAGLRKSTDKLWEAGEKQFLVSTQSAAAAMESALAAKESTKLAREEFIASHRPRIIVHGMDVKLAGEGELRRVNFRYVNAGDTDAFVTSISSRILWTKYSMVPADIEFMRHDVIKDPILVPSGKNGFAITPDEVNFVTLVRSGRGGHDTAYCVGVIVYRDTNDIERRTGFCRRYDSQRERWLKAEDEDYEYSY